MNYGDWEGAYSIGGNIFARIVYKLASQPKFKDDYGVESWVSALHYREKLLHRTEVLIHAALLSRVLVVDEHPRSHQLHKGMEERDWLLYAVEVRRYSQPGTEC